MSKTVVGMFASTAVAQSAKEQLVSAGYSPSTVQIVAQDSLGTNGTPSQESSDTGLGAKISNFFHSLTGGDAEENYYAHGVKQGGALLSVTVADGEEEDVADLLEDYGAKNVNESAATATASAAGVSARPAASQANGDSATIPVVQEELKIGKRQVDRGGVRIFSHLVETPVEENIKLREERVRVDRQAVNRPATEADFTAFKEGSIELTETAEEAVVSKSARVVEEVAIGKETSERTQNIRDTVRHTEVEVTGLGGSAASGFAEHETAHREHFESAYAPDGEAYEDYAPAYEYGHSLAGDPRYVSSNWPAVEPEAEKDWASRGSGKWEDFKGAVQQGWNKVRDSTSSKS